MNTIACLGWGSLVWSPEALPVELEWRKDGPDVCVEFLRQSGDGRITLVLDSSAAPVPCLWARMTSPDMASAAEALRVREKIPMGSFSRSVGQWFGGPSPALIPNLEIWAAARGIQGAVWTSLPPKLKDAVLPPSEEVVIAYLRTLKGKTLIAAEEYIRRAPVQIETPYRRRIASELGWTPQTS